MDVCEADRARPDLGGIGPSALGCASFVSARGISFSPACASFVVLVFSSPLGVVLFVLLVCCPGPSSSPSVGSCFFKKVDAISVKRTRKERGQDAKKKRVEKVNYTLENSKDR